MTLQAKHTRFRAYQLGSAGSSFSYYDGNTFTLIEARLTDINKASIKDELKICGKDYIDTLHITSWDQDHCTPSQLQEILDLWHPSKIEYPGYPPHTDSGIESLQIITGYRSAIFTKTSKVKVDPLYIDGLNPAKHYGYSDIFYHPKSIDPNSSNNNSTVKQFRTGSFNVLSLGDVESPILSAGLRSQKTIQRETDIIILAHHGADNGFTTNKFIEEVRPSFAVATSNYDNQFEHPRQEIRDILYKNNVPLFTTKTGDLIVRSIGGHVGKYVIENYISNGDKLSSRKEEMAKKFYFLKQNSDTIRNIINRPNRGP